MTQTTNDEAMSGETTSAGATNEFDRHDADPITPDARPARPRTASLLEDEQRAAFLAEWDAVQTGFIADPRRTAEAAERLVATLADSVIRRVGEIAESVGARPSAVAAEADTADTVDTADTADTAEPSEVSEISEVSEGDEETWREQLLRCREAFHLLIDS